MKNFCITNVDEQKHKIPPPKRTTEYMYGEQSDRMRVGPDFWMNRNNFGNDTFASDGSIK